jgi:hypothetical protein
MMAIPEALLSLLSQAKRGAPIREAQQRHALPPRGTNLGGTWKTAIGQDGR